MGAQRAAAFAPLSATPPSDAPPPDASLASLRRVRRRLGVQRWLFGLGWFFLAISLSTEFTTYRGCVVHGARVPD